MLINLDFKSRIDKGHISPLADRCYRLHVVTDETFQSVNDGHLQAYGTVVRPSSFYLKKLRK